MERRSYLGHDADGTVLLQDGDLHVLRRIQAVFTERLLEVVVVEALLIECLRDPAAVLADYRGRKLEQPSCHGIAAAQLSDQSIHREDRDDNDDGARNRGIAAGDCGLQRIGGEQHQRQVEEGELPDLPLAEYTQCSEEEHVHEHRPKDQLQRWDPKLPHRDRWSHTRAVTKRGEAEGVRERGMV